MGKTRGLRLIRRPIRDQEGGFTITEIVIAMGLMGIIALIMTQMGTNAAKSSKGASTTTEMVQVANMLTGLLSNPNGCKRALQGPLNAALGDPDSYCTDAGGTQVPCTSPAATPFPPAAPAFGEPSIYRNNPATSDDDRYIEINRINSPRWGGGPDLVRTDDDPITLTTDERTVIGNLRFTRVRFLKFGLAGWENPAPPAAGVNNVRNLEFDMEVEMTNIANPTPSNTPGAGAVSALGVPAYSRSLKLFVTFVQPTLGGPWTMDSCSVRSEVLADPRGWQTFPSADCVEVGNPGTPLSQPALCPTFDCDVAANCPGNAGCDPNLGCAECPKGTCGAGMVAVYSYQAACATGVSVNAQPNCPPGKYVMGITMESLPATSCGKNCVNGGGARMWYRCCSVKR
jgi:hypothetical protein